MSTFDTFGLWWLIGATVVSLPFVGMAVSARKVSVQLGSWMLACSIVYILFYLHLLGVLK